MEYFTVFLLTVLMFSCDKKNSGEIVVDERDQTESVIEIIKIDSVWSGHPVRFSLYTHLGSQYIAYYNANRNMVVGQRKLTDKNFVLHQMFAPTRALGQKDKSKRFSATEVGWDSHNSITMAVDKEGFIHLSGNMHVDSLTYFRSELSGDISTLMQHFPLVGSNEKKSTYPKFMLSKEQELIFHYRDGSSGNGNEIYNTYDTQKKKWSRMLDVPLTDGQGLMNAYQSQPEVREDGWYHVYWVWRDTPDCSTNHDLSYMKSPDLKNWYDAFDQPIVLPATLDKKSLIVAPVPPKGGIINLAAKLCLDKNNKPVFTYHKYDESGNIQLYIAKIEGDEWISNPISQWDYRWEFSGNGSINVELRINSFDRREDERFEIGYWHKKYGTGTLLLDEAFTPIGKVLKTPKLLTNSRFKKQLEIEGSFPGLVINSVPDIGEVKEKNIRYVLKWETLNNNRDKPRPKPWPSPSQLYLYKLKTK